MLLNPDLSDKILHAFYKVYNTLGFGFLEKVYQNALYYELVLNGLKVEAQKPIKVYYEDKVVGEYYADIVVEDAIILELKAAEDIIDAHELQLINYLKASNIEIGLLLNFGKKAKAKRKIYTNDRKAFL